VAATTGLTPDAAAFRVQLALQGGEGRGEEGQRAGQGCCTSMR
jgi:hypothetical protein